MHAGVAPGLGLAGGDRLDELGQRWPAKVLVFDVDELGRVVDGLQVELLDVALALLGLGAEDLRDLSGGVRDTLQLRSDLHGLP
ncbi:hypothetical protein D3C76_722990 [compost metagenome]